MVGIKALVNFQILWTSVSFVSFDLLWDESEYIGGT